MDDRRTLVKDIVNAIGPLIDAKIETVKTVLLAEIKSIKTDVGKLQQRMDSIEQKLDGKLNDHESRINKLETSPNDYSLTRS